MTSPRLLFAAALTLALSSSSSAQVSVVVDPSGVRVQAAGLGSLTMSRVAAKSTVGASWTITDSHGFSYTAGGYDADSDSLGGGGGGGTRPPNGGGSGGGGPIIVGGYDGEAESGPTRPPRPPNGGGSGGGGPIIVGGYDEALDFLRLQRGATVRYDAVLSVHHIDFPGQADPIGYFFQVVTQDSLRGHPLYRHFRLVDVPSTGAFDPVAADLAKTAAPRLPFPNDALYRLQWGLTQSRLLLAQWHPVAARKAIHVGLLDSGVGTANRAHPGLDGVQMSYTAVAPTTGFPVAHGLGLATLFADRSNDGSGTVGLIGGWGTNECFPQPPLMAQAQPRLSVYNVGDFGPNSYSVARALYAAAAAGIDVVNLSLHVAPSAMVEEAVRAAQQAGVIVVAAAGNYPASATARPTRFPASLDGVISVGAVDERMRVAAFSARDGVDLYAPGTDIVVGGSNGTWVYGNGTSYAAPHVVATIALMRAANPAVTAAEALTALQRFAIRSGGVPTLNALSALNAVLPENARVRLPTVAPGCSFAGAFFGKDDAPLSTVAYDARIDDDLFAAEAPTATSLVGVYPNPARSRATVAFDLDARQTVRVTVHDALGREVARLADGLLDIGAHRLDLDGTDLASGVYLVRVAAERGTFTRAVTFVR